MKVNVLKDVWPDINILQIIIQQESGKYFSKALEDIKYLLKIRDILKFSLVFLVMKAR